LATISGRLATSYATLIRTGCTTHIVSPLVARNRTACRAVTREAPNVCRPLA
jgi:hypothetical protein